MKTLTVTISLALLLSGCTTQKEIQKNHSTGLYFNELNNLIIRKEQHRQSHKVHHLYHQLHHQSKNQNMHNCTTSWVVFLYYHDIGDNVSNIMKGALKLWP